MSFCIDNSSRTSGLRNHDRLPVGKLQVGQKYNWKNQKERLVYLGNNFSGNGFWHQFAKVESPDIVWCAVLDSDLLMIEETKATYKDGV